MSTVWLEVLPGLSEELTPGNRERRRLEGPTAAGCTLRELLDSLTGRLPAAGRALYDAQARRLHAHVLLTINGRLIAPERALDTILSDGDRVVLFPVYTGG